MSGAGRPTAGASAYEHLIVEQDGHVATITFDRADKMNAFTTQMLRDITAILLNAWSWVGSNDFKRALETVEQLKDPRFAGFRDYHAALIADLSKNTVSAPPSGVSCRRTSKV